MIVAFYQQHCCNYTASQLLNGHNYQDDRMRIYLPGNGGVLTAADIMVAGYDRCTVDAPAIPKDGTWKVKWEGLKKMPLLAFLACWIYCL